MNLKGISAIRIFSVKSIPIMVEEDEGDESWSEIEVTVRFSKGKEIVEEKLSFLKFKELMREADRKGIEVNYIEAKETKESKETTHKKCGSCPNHTINVIDMARDILKKEKEIFDPSIC